MALTYIANGTISASSPTYPAGLASGDLLAMAICTTGTIDATPSGFTLVFGPTTSSGVTVAFYQKRSDGTESGSVSVSTTGTTRALIWGWHGSVENPNFSTITYGEDTTSGTSWSATSPSRTTQTNDIVRYFSVLNADGTVPTSRTLSQSGATLGGIASGMNTGTTGIRFSSYEATVSAGGTGAFAHTSTTSVSCAGLTAFMVVHEGSVAQSINVGQNSETDTAQPTTHSKSKASGLSSETDTAQPTTKRKTKSIGLLSSAETALPITLSTGTATGIASDVETAREIVPLMGSRTDWALSITPLTSPPNQVGTATEADTVLPVSSAKRKTLGLALESDLTQATGRWKFHSFGQATEVEVALPLELSVTTFRFRPPTFSEQHRKKGAWFQLDRSMSVVRDGDTFRTVLNPFVDDLVGIEGEDFFLGGREYTVSSSTAAELIAAGFELSDSA